MKEARALLPSEDFIYFADSAYCPYGDKPPEVLRKRAFAICDFLLERGTRLIVIACNTISIAALDDVRRYVSVPVVGIEPAVKPAVSATRNGKIGVLATGVTLAGERFNALVRRYGRGIEVYTQPCPGLVELVESGNWERPEAEIMLERYLGPLLARGVDTVVLGCTHYPFLRPLVEKLAGGGVTVIDTGRAVARQIKNVLEASGLASGKTAPGTERFFTSARPEVVEPVVRALWGDPGLAVERAEI